jgi:hypothetical protein
VVSGPASARNRSCNRRRAGPGRLLNARPAPGLQAALDEIATLGAAYDLSTGAIRPRLLLLERHIEETLERWPMG